MTESTINPEVVDLLTRFGIDGTPADGHGRTATPDEMALMGTARWADLEAARRMLAMAVDLHTERQETTEKLVALLEPWMSVGPAVEDAIAAAPPDVATEAMALCERLNALSVMCDGA